MFASNRQPRLARRKSCVYAGGTPGGNHDHRHFDRAVAAGSAGGPRSGTAMQCSNNVKQLALGCLGHESATGRFPAGGWGFGWTGDADRGNDWRPAGRVDLQHSAFHRAAGVARPGAWDSAWNEAAKKAAHLLQTVVPLNVLYCPTRRPAIVYPWRSDGWGFANADMPTLRPVRTTARTAERLTPIPPPADQPGESYENDAGGPIAVTQIESPPGEMTSRRGAILPALLPWPPASSIVAV